VIFDTDVLIWVQRGNRKAATAIDAAKERFISIQSFMELLQGAQDKRQLRLVKDFLADLSFTALPLSDNIGHRALIYVEEYGISSGMRAGDAIVAATAVENNLPLMSGNAKHLKVVKDLDLHVFRP